MGTRERAEAGRILLHLGQRDTWRTPSVTFASSCPERFGRSILHPKWLGGKQKFRRPLISVRFVAFFGEAPVSD